MGQVTSYDTDVNHARNFGDETQTALGLTIEPRRLNPGQRQHGRPEISINVGISQQSECKSLAHILSALCYYMKQLREDRSTLFPELVRGQESAVCDLAMNMTFEEGAELCQQMAPLHTLRPKLTKVTQNGVVLTKHVVALTIRADRYTGPICELVRITAGFPQLQRLYLDINEWFCRRASSAIPDPCDTLYKVVECALPTWTTPFLQHVWLGLFRTVWNTDDQLLDLVRAMLWILNSRRLYADSAARRPTLLLDLRHATILKDYPSSPSAVYLPTHLREVGDQKNWLRRWRQDRTRRSFLQEVGSSPDWCLEPGSDCVLWVLDHETASYSSDVVVFQCNLEGEWRDPLFEDQVLFRGSNFKEEDWYKLQPHQRAVLPLPCAGRHTEYEGEPYTTNDASGCQPGQQPCWWE